QPCKTINFTAQQSIGELKRFAKITWKSGGWGQVAAREWAGPRRRTHGAAGCVSGRRTGACRRVR
ncbi:hypothetical protein CRG98_049067, partial [Punica granatum]